MKNIIFNELLIRGYQVDVRIVEIYEKDEQGKYVRKQIEVDFVANKGEKRCYIQSAFSLPTLDKVNQEEATFAQYFRFVQKDCYRKR